MSDLSQYKPNFSTQGISTSPELEYLFKDLVINVTLSKQEPILPPRNVGVILSSIKSSLPQYNFVTKREERSDVLSFSDFEFGATITESQA
jgi:hypothetical protein